MGDLDRELVFTENQNEGLLGEKKLMKESLDVVLQMNRESLRRSNEAKVEFGNLEQEELAN